MAEKHLLPADLDTYVSELTRRLRRQLPEAEATELAAETRAHLEDRVADLQINGMPAEQAQTIAVAGFGRTAIYARSLADAAVESAHSRLAHGVRRALFGTLFVALAVLMSAGPPQRSLLLIAFPTLLVAAILCAVAARRPATASLLRYGAALLLVSIVAAGFSKTVRTNGQWADRRGFGQNRTYVTEALLPAQAEERLLQEGIAVYADAARQRVVPPELRCGGGFIVPIPARYAVGAAQPYNLAQGCGLSAFRPILITPRRDGYTMHYSAEPYAAVASVAVAREAWRRYGRPWLQSRQADETRLQTELADYARIEAQPRQFLPELIWWDDLVAVPITATIVALDWLAAEAGRRLFLLLRRRKRRLPST